MQHKSDGYGIIRSCWLAGYWLAGCWLLVSFGCNQPTSTPSNPQDKPAMSEEVEPPSPTPFKVNPDYFVDGFDYPVGKPDAKGYYNAQIFGKNNHLGDDWNGTGGGNSDLGDPIYATANGYVKFARNITGGWGKVIRINHFWKDGRTCESLYAHCDKMETTAGTWVNKGDLIGTIGNADGAYWAHLHFEMRSDTGLEIGGGYDWDTTGFVDPTKFIEANRKIE